MLGRWGMLAVYCGVCLSNGMVWSTFSSISNDAKDYYDTSLDFINWFEMCFFICYFPPAPFVSWLVGKNLHWGMLLSTGMTFLGCWLRYLAGANISLAFTGQMTVAIVNSPVMAACSAVTAQWFPPHEQPLANTLSSLSSFIGIGVQFVLGPMISDIPTILLIHAAISSLTLLISFFSIRKSPNPYIPKESSHSGCRWIKNKNLMTIMLSSGAVVGVGSGFIGILLVILEPSGYNPIYTGYIGMILVTSGSLGGYVATKLVEKERYIQPTIWTYMIISIASSILFAALIENKIASMILASLVGFSIIGFVPLGFKMSVSSAKEIEESIPANIIWGSAQIYSLILTYAMEYFEDGTGVTSLWCVPMFIVVSYGAFVYASRKNAENFSEVNFSEKELLYVE